MHSNAQLYKMRRTMFGTSNFRTKFDTELICVSRSLFTGAELCLSGINSIELENYRTRACIDGRLKILIWNVEIGEKIAHT